MAKKGNRNKFSNNELDSLGDTIVGKIKEICPATKTDIEKVLDCISLLDTHISAVETSVSNKIKNMSEVLEKILQILNIEGQKNLEENSKNIQEIEVAVRHIIDILKQIEADFSENVDLLMRISSLYKAELLGEDQISQLKDELRSFAQEADRDVEMIIQSIEQTSGSIQKIEKNTGQHISKFLISPEAGVPYDKKFHIESVMSCLLGREKGISEVDKVIDKTLLFGIYVGEEISSKKALVNCKCKY